MVSVQASTSSSTTNASSWPSCFLQTLFTTIPLIQQHNLDTRHLMLTLFNLMTVIYATTDDDPRMIQHSYSPSLLLLAWSRTALSLQLCDAGSQTASLIRIARRRSKLPGPVSELMIMCHFTGLCSFYAPMALGGMQQVDVYLFPCVSVCS